MYMKQGHIYTWTSRLYERIGLRADSLKILLRKHFLSNNSLTATLIGRPVGDSEANHPVECRKDGGDEGQGPLVHHINPEDFTLYRLVIYMGNIYHFACLATSYPVVMLFLIT